METNEGIKLLLVGKGRKIGAIKGGTRDFTYPQRLTMSYLQSNGERGWAIYH